MSKRVILAALVLFAAAGALIYWFFQAEAPIRRDETPEAPPVLSYIGNTMSEQRDGKTVWELNAETIEINAETKNAAMKNINGKFYQEDGRVVTLKAPRAEYFVDTKDISIDGGVEIEADDGTKAAAKTMRWIAAEGKLAGEDSVRLERDETVVTGDRIESTDGFRKFKVIGNAHIVKGGADS